MKRWVGYLQFLSMCIALQGCKGLLKKTPQESVAENPTTPAEEDSLDPVGRSLVSSLRLRLEASNISSESKEKIVAGARSELESATKASKLNGSVGPTHLKGLSLYATSNGLDFSAKLSLLLKGASKAMASISELNSGGKRLGLLKEVVKFGVESTRKFEKEIPAGGVQNVISDVVKAVVETVDSSGVSEDERAEAIVGMVGSAVASIKDAAVDGDGARLESMKAIVAAAVSSIADAGLPAGTLTQVVSEIAESSIKNASAAGLSQAVLGEAAKEVTSAAVASATQLAQDAGIDEIKPNEVSAAVVKNVVGALADAGVGKEALAATAAAVSAASIQALVDTGVGGAVLNEAKTSVQTSAADGLSSTGQLSQAEIDAAKEEIASKTEDASSGNSAPEFSDIADQSTLEDTIKTVTFTISDSDNAVKCSDVVAESDNEALLPNIKEHLAITSGSSTNCKLMMKPAPNAYGSTSIVLTLSDGSSAENGTVSTSFGLEVEPVNDPAILMLPNENQVVFTDEGEPTQEIGFEIFDVENQLSCSDVFPISDKEKIVPNDLMSNIQIYGGDGASCSLVVTPAPYQTGDVNISLIIKDGAITISKGIALTVNPAAHVDFNIASEVKFAAWQDGDGAWVPWSLADCAAQGGCLRSEVIRDPLRRGAVWTTCETVGSDSTVSRVQSRLSYGVAMQGMENTVEVKCPTVEAPQNLYSSGWQNSGTMQAPPDQTSGLNSGAVTLATDGLADCNNDSQSNYCEVILIPTDAVSSFFEPIQLTAGQQRNDIPYGQYKAYFTRGQQTSTMESIHRAVSGVKFKDVTVDSVPLNLSVTSDGWETISHSSTSVSILGLSADVKLHSLRSFADGVLSFLSLSEDSNMAGLPVDGPFGFTRLAANTMNVATNLFLELNRESQNPTSRDHWYVSKRVDPAQTSPVQVDVSQLPLPPSLTRQSQGGLGIVYSNAPRVDEEMFFMKQVQPQIDILADKEVELLVVVQKERIPHGGEFSVPVFSQDDGWDAKWNFQDYGAIRVMGRSHTSVAGLNQNYVHEFERILPPVQGLTPPVVTRDGQCSGELPANAVQPNYTQSFDWQSSEWDPPTGEYWTDGMNQFYSGSQFPKYFTAECRYSCAEGFVSLNGQCIATTMAWTAVDSATNSVGVLTGNFVGELTANNFGLSSAAARGNAIAVASADSIFTSQDGGTTWSTQALGGMSDVAMAFTHEVPPQLVVTYRDAYNGNLFRMFKTEGSSFTEPIQVNGVGISGQSNKILFTDSNGKIYSLYFLNVMDPNNSENPPQTTLRLSSSVNHGADWSETDISGLFAHSSSPLDGCDSGSRFEMAEGANASGAQVLLLAQYRSCSGISEIVTSVFDGQNWQQAQRSSIDPSHSLGKLVAQGGEFRIYSAWRMGSYLKYQIDASNQAVWEPSVVPTFWEPMVTMESVGSDVVYLSYRGGGSSLTSTDASQLDGWQPNANGPNSIPRTPIADDAMNNMPALAIADGDNLHVFWISAYNYEIRHSFSPIAAGDMGRNWNTSPQPQPVQKTTLVGLDPMQGGWESLSGGSDNDVKAMVLAGGTLLRTNDQGASWASSSLSDATWLNQMYGSGVSQLIAEGDKYHILTQTNYAFTSDSGTNWTVRPRSHDPAHPTMDTFRWAVSGALIAVPTLKCEMASASVSSKLSLSISSDAGLSWTQSMPIEVASSTSANYCPMPELNSVGISGTQVFIMYRTQNDQSNQLWKVVYNIASRSWTDPVALLQSDATGSLFINNILNLDGGVLVNYMRQLPNSQPVHSSKVYSSALVDSTPAYFPALQYGSGNQMSCIRRGSSILCPNGQGGIQGRAGASDWTLSSVDLPVYGQQLLLNFSDKVGLVYQSPVEGFIKFSSSVNDGASWQ